MASELDVRARLQRAGQEHLLRFCAELAPGPRAALLAQLEPLEPEALREHCRRAAAACARPPAPAPDLAARLRPLPPERVGSASGVAPQTRRLWEEEGFHQIALNKVAVLLLAGGQGTRLGVTYPKGMYQVGLPSQKTLYQLQAERIRRVEQLAGERYGTRCTVPWYIMTSEFTLGPTAKFFKEHDFFHLDPNNVVMFEQRMLPAVTFDGRAILERKDKVAMAPDGNGGLYCALADHQVLEDMERRGVEFVHVYCVDNILVRLADPVFIGFCVLRGADCGAKVVEYSEISPETARLRAPGGGLLYNAGNICNHFFTRDFLQMVTREFEPLLKPHVAVKKVPYVDEEGNPVKPLEPNGIKMEKFVFDVLPFAKNFVAFQVLRGEEFSPLKNADSAERDNPSTARRALLAQHHRWALQAGAHFLDAHGARLPEQPRDWRCTCKAGSSSPRSSWTWTRPGHCRPDSLLDLPAPGSPRLRMQPRPGLQGGKQAALSSGCRTWTTEGGRCAASAPPSLAAEPGGRSPAPFRARLRPTAGRDGSPEAWPARLALSSLEFRPRPQPSGASGTGADAGGSRGGRLVWSLTRRGAPSPPSLPVASDRSRGSRSAPALWGGVGGAASVFGAMAPLLHPRSLAEAGRNQLALVSCPWRGCSGPQCPLPRLEGSTAAPASSC
ncbi:UDP-N-acetylhexosamine pyrophosphorylase-like protein 1 isoform X2 [Balaenoptera musculus]|uniref:UDP-N-acetylhexosamine pyrophosphorylase-like protein 1 isoform X2 n=1 Tax=Balaenoptera musculus TaxID=9771 RepID=A0A8B8XLW2_BALMU|nr:UDP-N-acetylhexosamine pyrophosphorylase-like protein 1 isoform X2 [Balaenoptera musculus]